MSGTSIDVLRRPASGAVRCAILCLVGLMGATPAKTSALRNEGETFGCRSMANASRLLTLRQAGDPSEYDTRLQRLVRAGECRVWTASEPMTAEDESDGLVCLTPQGARGLCYWSPPSNPPLSP